MAAGPILLASFTNVDATTTVALPGNGGYPAATFLVNITGITRTTGTLDVSVKYGPVSTLNIIIADRSAALITATGLYRLTLTADFNAAQMAIPAPNFLTLTLAGDTADVAGSIYAIYGD